MSEYTNEHKPGLLTEESARVVMTRMDSGPDPYVASEASAPGGQSTQSDDSQGKMADVKDTAKESGQHVADVVKDQAGNVAAEAKIQAKDLLGQGRDELRQQTAQQQERVARGLHSISDELHSMASGSAEQGLAADLARQAADHTRTVATWLEEREPGELLDEVKHFARQRPGVFLALAAAGGVLAGRLGRGLKDGEPEPAAASTGRQPRVAAPFAPPSAMAADCMGADPLATGPLVREPMGNDPLAAGHLAGTAGGDSVYGSQADSGYGSTVKDPVIDTASGDGRLP